MTKTRVRISINGNECNIASDENESYVRSIAAEVDDAIQKVSRANSGLPKTIINILVMMDFCDRARKASDTLDNMNIRMKECVETAAKSQVLAEKLKEDNNSLNQELIRIKKHNRI